jgi:hypothetical protein
MSSIFPSIQPEIEESATEQLPLCREVGWDFTNGVPIFSGGRPTVVTGAEAVKVWIWKALMTVRCRHDVYTWDYGCEVERLIGKAYTAQVKESEAARYVREALLPNPYIKAVRQADVTFSGCLLSISCTVSTIYGEVSVSV